MVLLVATSAFFGAVSIGRQEKVIKDFGLFSLSFFGAVIAILCGVSLLNTELKKKTVYNILSKPVSRWQFIAGKFCGLALTVNVLVALMGVGLVLFNYCFEGRIDWLLFQGIVFALLESTIVCAVAVFFSSLVVTTTLTGIFTLGFYLGGRSINYLGFFLSSDDSTPTAMAAAVKAFDFVLPDLSVFNVGNIIVYGEAISGAHFMYATFYCFCYSMVAIGLATLIFRTRDLT
jgi:ABC-type transport system involved in multi-copper enzyme maturation permease subunit